MRPRSQVACDVIGQSSPTGHEGCIWHWQVGTLVWTTKITQLLLLL